MNTALLLADWKVMQIRGRSRVRKARKDPVARAKLRADIPAPKPVIEHLSDAERRLALAPVPSYLFDSSALQKPDEASSRAPFVTRFPAEIRNIIYQFALEYPTCQELYDSYYRQLDKAKSLVQPCLRGSIASSFKAAHRTPTVLLLCKQITREALTILRLRTFVVDRIPPWIMGNPRPLPLTELIGARTLQNLRSVEVRLTLGENIRAPSGDIWYQVLKDILDAWSKRNTLVRMRVMIKVANVFQSSIWDHELPKYRKLIGAINDFEFKHGYKPGMVTFEHWVIDNRYGHYAYKTGYRNPLIRQHPDPNIWQGSVIEWL
ncbi:hypothetical protein F4780DRAFT_133978 [Xylariomycetidae sp. FL0641]|nr:hypothetical protein F4780DRAFT_133978 [Xylariomycetidae sp. FL0641]